MKGYFNENYNLYETGYLHLFCFHPTNEIHYLRVFLNDWNITQQVIRAPSLEPRAMTYIRTSGWNYFAILFSPSSASPFPPFNKIAFYLDTFKAVYLTSIRLDFPLCEENFLLYSPSS